MTRRLARSVVIGRKAYPAGTELSEELAAKVTNPRAWGEAAGAGGEASDDEAPTPAPPAPASDDGPDDGPDDEASGPDVEPVQVEVEKPNGNASKAKWVAYAVAMGMPQAEAEAFDRDELRDHYSGS